MRMKGSFERKITVVTKEIDFEQHDITIIYDTSEFKIGDIRVISIFTSHCSSESFEDFLEKSVYEGAELDDAGAMRFYYYIQSRKEAKVEIEILVGKNRIAAFLIKEFFDARLKIKVGEVEQELEIEKLFSLMQGQSKKEICEMRYPVGTIVELVEPIRDSYSPKPAGAKFRVDYIDDQLQLHGKWLEPESGCLAVDIRHDSFKIERQSKESKVKAVHENLR